MKIQNTKAADKFIALQNFLEALDVEGWDELKLSEAAHILNELTDKIEEIDLTKWRQSNQEFIQAVKERRAAQ